MPRSISTQATVFSLKPQGENNSTVCFFTQTEGIVYATLYGGRKSRMKSLVSPWNTGTAYFSKDSKTGFLKVSDFDVKKYHLTFRENLLKYYASSLAAELMIKTKCAGNSENAWALLNGFIDGLDLCATDGQCRAGIIRFLWRFLELLGIQPDASLCASCGTDFLSGKIESDTVSYKDKGAEFLLNENQFICSDCRNKNEKPVFYLNGDAVRYLAAVSKLPPQDSRNYPLSEESFFQTKELAFYLIEKAVGTKLNTIESGRSLL